MHKTPTDNNHFKITCFYVIELFSWQNKKGHPKIYRNAPSPLQLFLNLMLTSQC